MPKLTVEFKMIGFNLLFFTCLNK